MKIISEKLKEAIKPLGDYVEKIKAAQKIGERKFFGSSPSYGTERCDVISQSEITAAVFEALNKHKAIDIEHFKQEIINRDKRIEELEIELHKYKQACIELDNQLTTKENDIGDMKLEKHSLLETIDTKEIEKMQIVSDLELAKKGILPEVEKQNLFDKIKSLFK